MIKRYKEDEVDELVQILRNDGVISVPTDTVYGLCARINSKEAYNNLMHVKNRPSNKLFPIMCADKEQIKSISIVDEKVEKLIDRFMPGPITLVLKKRVGLFDFVNNGGATIAVRMATSKVLEDIIRKIGCPIFMTSANQSGEPVAHNPDEIEKTCPLIDGILEGEVSFGEASTIVDCTLEEVKILRTGPITMEKIKEIICKNSEKEK